MLWCEFKLLCFKSFVCFISHIWLIARLYNYINWDVKSLIALQYLKLFAFIYRNSKKQTSHQTESFGFIDRFNFTWVNNKVYVIWRAKKVIHHFISDTLQNEQKQQQKKLANCLHFRCFQHNLSVLSLQIRKLLISREMNWNHLLMLIYSVENGTATWMR